jgi:hypothetical protein
MWLLSGIITRERSDLSAVMRTSLARKKTKRSVPWGFKLAVSLKKPDT